MHGPPEMPAPTVPQTDDFARLVAGALERRTPRAEDRPGRAAAVLLPILDRAGVPHILLTKRSDGLSHHPGQISLPGGRPERVDRDARDTALRETHEELAIPPERVAILGALDQMHTVASDFVISPYVGLVDSGAEIVPNETEVAGVLEAPVAHLLSADLQLPANPGRLGVRYPLAGEDVWGATAHILRGFAHIIRAALGASER